MFSYIKLLVAVGLALAVVIIAGLWFQNRTRSLETLKKEKGDLKIRVAEMEGCAASIAELKTRLETCRRNIADITGRFAGKDHAEPQLVNAVREAVKVSGMKTTGMAKTDAKAEIPGMKGMGTPVNVISYDISLKGAYTGLVKFFQNVAVWQLKNKIEDVEISTSHDDETAGEIVVNLVLSVFSAET